MSDDATPAKVRLTDGLGPLPEPAGLLAHEDGSGFVDCYDADQMRAYAAQERAAERERMRAMIADDASAITYQSIGQYRTALLLACGPNVGANLRAAGGPSS